MAGEEDLKNNIDNANLSPEEIKIREEENLKQNSGYLDPRVVEMVTPAGARDLEAVYDISVKVSAVLGKSTMAVGNLLKLEAGRWFNWIVKWGRPLIFM